MDTFSIDLARFGDNALNNAEKIVRKIALDLHGRIVARTPVATGRAKANNQVSLGSLGTNVVERDEPTALGTPAPITESEAKAKARAYKLGQSIFIYNNVHYITLLEFHHQSTQAPSGMFRISFMETMRQLGGVQG